MSSRAAADGSTGTGVGAGREKARIAMKRPEFAVRIDLGRGAAQARYVTGDLSTDYVRFNSAYST